MTKRQIKKVTKENDDVYEYSKHTSMAPASFYGENLLPEEYENRHLNHMISDYEEDGIEVLDAECEFKDGVVIMSCSTRQIKLKTKKANKIVAVERWIIHQKKNYCYKICAEQLPNGKWVCEIKIPKTKFVAKATSKTETNAMLRAADKAYTIIKEFVKTNQNEQSTLAKIKGWEMQVGKNGEYISINLSKKQREKDNQQLQTMKNKTFEATEKLIESLSKINGTSKGLVVQIMDKSFFGKTPTENEIAVKMWNIFGNKYNANFLPTGVKIDDDHVIAIGFAYSKVRKETR